MLPVILKRRCLRLLDQGDIRQDLFNAHQDLLNFTRLLHRRSYNTVPTQGHVVRRKGIQSNDMNMIEQSRRVFHSEAYFVSSM